MYSRGFYFVFVFSLQWFQFYGADLDQCCQNGRLQVTQVNISLSSSTYDDVDASWDICTQLDDRDGITTECRYLQQVCCLSQLRMEACQAGIDWARRNNMNAISYASCHNISTEYFQFSQISQECCMCCMLTSWDFNNAGVTDALCIHAKDTCQSPLTTNQPKITTDIVTDSVVTNDDIYNDVPSWYSSETPMPLETESLDTSYTTSSSDATEDVLLTTPQPMVCMDEYTWNPFRQVCERLVFSCPLGFIMNTTEMICVKSDKPFKPCSIGYKLDRLTMECVDVNECAANSSLCSESGQMCINSEGGYSCKCQTGFLIQPDKSCSDIDECELYSTSPCTMGYKCKNTVGAFECVREVPCGFGYSLNPLTQECNDINECVTYPDICGPGMICVNVRGGHRCNDKACPKGMKLYSGKCAYCSNDYIYDEETKKCIDIDECAVAANKSESMCRSFETCINVPGSYICKPNIICKHGTIINKNGTSCLDVNECIEKLYQCNADQICINKYASYYCVVSPCRDSQTYDYVKQMCICKEGYRLNAKSMCEDVNECEEKGAKTLCGEFQCVNTPGSYYCYYRASCPKGMFQPSLYSSCIDVDECVTGDAQCGKHQICKNTQGSYMCVCENGFKKIHDQCIDIDECVLFRSDETCPDVNSRCINLPGSYKCTCPQGYRWSGFRKKKCEDIDECTDQPDICGLGHNCQNLLGSFQCHCRDGFTQSPDGTSCQDIDECAIMLPGNIKRCPNGLCVNIPGDYQCQCPKGYQLGRNSLCVDINECIENTGVCVTYHADLPGSACINLAGTYKCVINHCPNNYQMTTLGVGFKCSLDNSKQCAVEDKQCLKTRPYRIFYQFIEIDESTSLPQTLTRIDQSYLPKGNNRMGLNVKYTIDMETNKAKTDRLNSYFRIVKSRHVPNSLEIRLLRQIAAPTETFLEMETSVYYRNDFIGHAVARIFIYVTKYPKGFS